MRSNENLKTAKKTKNDEFYTQYADIEEEVINYKDKLKGKVFIVIAIPRQVNS